MPENSPSLSRRTLLAAFALGGIGNGAFAQGAQPIRMIVGVPPGSSTDVIARLTCDALAKVLGQPVIIDNKPGGSGSIATAAFLAAPRDGQTWLFAVNGFFSEAPHSLKLTFDPMKEAKPLVEIGGSGLVLVGNASLPPQNMQELVAWVRANPGRVSFASYSPGSLSHVLGLLLNKAERLDMLHVPYKGSPPALQDIMGGSDQLMFDAPPSSLPFVQGGKMRAYAVTSPKRLDVLPEVPTFAELGYKEMTRTAWLGLWTTPDAPAAAQLRMRNAMIQALDQPAVRQRLAQFAFTTNTTDPATPEQLAVRLATDYTAVGDTLKSINYKPE